MNKLAEMADVTSVAFVDYLASHETISVADCYEASVTLLNVAACMAAGSCDNAGDGTRVELMDDIRFSLIEVVDAMTGRGDE